MERKLDAVEIFQEGYQRGQDVVIKLVNEYCGIDAKNVQQLIQAINQKVSHV